MFITNLIHNVKSSIRYQKKFLSYFIFQAQGVSLPEAGEKRPRPGTRVRPKKKKEEDKPEDQGEH